MKSRYLEVGQIVGTFGIKGELKFHSESDFIEDRLSKGNVLYLKQNDTYEPITINSARLHKNNYMITINGHNLIMVKQSDIIAKQIEGTLNLD